MTADATTNDERVQCDCPRFHNGLISIHTRRRHRKEANMIDLPDESPRRNQFQLDTISNDGSPPGNDSSRPRITATTILEEADHDHAPPVHDFDDWSMDIDGEDDGGFFSVERSQTTSEDEGDSNERDEEDVEDLLQMLTIDSGEESAFEDEDEEESEDEELEDLDDRMHDRTDDDDADSIRLLLLQFKELSGINHQGFKTNTWQ